MSLRCCLYISNLFVFFFFFFQAEDGIRDLTVTGVQTCALPISLQATCAECLGFVHGPPRKVTSTAAPDRKSTRLNSSHSQISYAVFCLKKKTTLTGMCPGSLAELLPANPRSSL